MHDVLTNREMHLIADRAYRRAHYTGLPLHQMLSSETSRFIRKHAGRIGSQLAESYNNEAEIAQQPGHEAADAVSTIPSPIPEGLHPDGGVVTDGVNFGDAAEAAMPDGLPASQVGGSKSTKRRTEGRQKADVQTNPVVTNDVTPEAAAVAKEKQANIGKRVSWKIGANAFTGIIKHVIPEGATPKSLGIEAGNDKLRTGHSYVVETEGTGKLSWPVLSTLTMLD